MTTARRSKPQPRAPGRGRVGLVVRFDRCRSRARPRARPRCFRRRRRAAAHRKRAPRASGWDSPAGSRVDALHEPASAVGARPRRCFDGRGVTVALAPGERLLDLAGWVWPVLLAMLVSHRFAERAAHSTTGRDARSSIRRSSCSPDRRRRCGRHRHGRHLVEPGSGERPHLPRQRPPSLPELRRLGFADGRSLQRARRVDAQLGVGAGERVADDARLRVRSRRRRLERREGRFGRTVTSWRPTCTPLARRACLRAVCPRRALRRRHLRARLRRGLPDAGRRGRADRLRDAVSVRPSGLPLVLLTFKRASALLPVAARTVMGRTRYGAGSALCRRGRATPHARSTRLRAS